ncbi:MAG TPA: retropepsin-like aspartic protease [Candidatus Cybelea sp.]|nr:retropepsin-like aspartic protease [Candidatus Cybelea sp.]
MAGREAAAARAPASVTLSSGLSGTRTTIPVSFNGRRASCVLDTGSSAIILSPMLARDAGLAGERGTFEVAPDGQTYADRESVISHFAVAGYAQRNVHALISSHLTGYGALCGYDFFMHFPTLIDRERSAVTLFPAASKVARMHCLPVNLSPRVPLARVEIDGAWLSQIVLDSGMAGGGALWNGVRPNPPGFAGGLSCGGSAFVRFAAGTPASSMPICTESERPDGYNGIIETNLPGIHAIAVDYPHRRICFEVASSSPAWARFNNLRSP